MRKPRMMKDKNRSKANVNEKLQIEITLRRSKVVYLITSKRARDFAERILQCVDYVEETKDRRDNF